MQFMPTVVPNAVSGVPPAKQSHRNCGNEIERYATSPRSSYRSQIRFAACAK